VFEGDEMDAPTDSCRPVVHPKLLSNKKVTLLPHIAGSTVDADKVSLKFRLVEEVLTVDAEL
jgi:phosphoglycerate dehydrogenase-like enzyme